MQSDWSRALSITTQHFSQSCGLTKRLPKATIKVTLMDQFSFQNLYCWFISEHFEHAWINPKKTTWSNSNFCENLTTLKIELYTSNSSCDIKIQKVLAIWLVKSILVYNLKTRHMVFAES